LLKLSPRLTRVNLLEYFGRKGYKLLDKRTGAIFKLQDIILEKKTTHITTQHRLSVFSDNDNLFRYKQDDILMVSELAENRNHDGPKIVIPS